MMKVVIAILGLLSAFSVVGAGPRGDDLDFVRESLDQFARKVQSLLDAAVPVEILSIDGFRVVREGEFGDRAFNWPVRKRTVTTDPVAIRSMSQLLVEIVKHSESEAFSQSDDGAVQFPPRCFFPECGFRVIREGKPVYILVSLSCRQIRTVDTDGNEDYTWFSCERRSEIDALLKSCGLPACLELPKHRGELGATDNPGDAQ